MRNYRSVIELKDLAVLRYLDEIIEVEQRNKSNDQKYSIYNSKTVLSSTKKKSKIIFK